MVSKGEDDFSELQEFVAGTLKAVMDGISEVQPSAKMRSPFGSGTHAYNAPKKIEFDIAVSADRTDSAKGGFSVKVLSVGAGVGAEGETSQSRVTRIKFAVRTEFKRDDSDRKIDYSSKGVV